MIEDAKTKILKDSRVVITGAGRGLGAALALTCADLGAEVVLCGRSQATLEVVANQIETRTGRSSNLIVLDLADVTNVERASNEILHQVPRVDVLINNGAMWLEQQQTPYLASEVVTVIGSAVTGTFLLTQTLIPALERSERPDVVTIGSISGLPNASLHNAGVPMYAAKQGQTALADGFRQMFWGTPIRSICIHPPWLDDISPLESEWAEIPNRAKGAQATNRDIVEAVLYAITQPRHITIASLVIDSDFRGLDFRSHFKSNT